MYYELDNNGHVIASSNGRKQERMVFIAEPKPEGDHLWDGTKWVPDLDKPAILAAYRWQKETGGLGNIATDRQTQATLAAARTMAKEDPNYTTVWKAKDGFTTLTAAQIIATADAVHDHVQDCFAAEAAVDLTQCNSEQEIKAAFDAAYKA